MRGDTATMRIRRWINSTKLVAGVFRRILGCRHSYLSPSYTVNDIPYRSCLECCAQLNKSSWTEQHGYYL